MILMKDLLKSITIKSDKSNNSIIKKKLELNQDFIIGKI